MHVHAWRFIGDVSPPNSCKWVLLFYFSLCSIFSLVANAELQGGCAFVYERKVRIDGPALVVSTDFLSCDCLMTFSEMEAADGNLIHSN